MHRFPLPKGVMELLRMGEGRSQLLQRFATTCNQTPLRTETRNKTYETVTEYRSGIQQAEAYEDLERLNPDSHQGQAVLAIFGWDLATKKSEFREMLSARIVHQLELGLGL